MLQTTNQKHGSFCFSKKYLVFSQRQEATSSLRLSPRPFANGGHALEEHPKSSPKSSPKWKILGPSFWVIAVRENSEVVIIYPDISQIFPINHNTFPKHFPYISHKCHKWSIFQKSHISSIRCLIDTVTRIQ